MAMQAAMAGAGIASNLISSFTSGKASARAAQQQYQYNLALQKQQQQWNEYMYKNRYQFERADKEAAGLNMLYGLSSAPTVTSGTNSVGMPDMVGEKNGKMQQILTGLQIGGELSARKAEIENVKQQTYTEQQNTLLRQHQAIGQQLDNLYKQKELTNYDKKLIMELKEAQSRISKNMAETASAYSNAELSRAKSENVRSVERQKIMLENRQKRRFDEVYENNPDMALFEAGSKEFGTSTLGNALNIVGTIKRMMQEDARNKRKSGARH